MTTEPTVGRITDWLNTQGLSDPLAAYFAWAMIGLGVLLLAWIANYITKRILLALIRRFVSGTRTKWDDALLNNRVFHRLSHLAPAIVIYSTAYLFQSVQTGVQRLALVYMTLVGMAAIFAFLNAVVDIYRSYEIARQRPIKGYIQIAKIVVTIALAIVAIGTLLNQNPLLLLSGFGAMTAVLLLVFKDSILGLVASIQLSGNDMVRIGDWIEMPRYNADGDVIDITLHTIKVQNWDKTISMIPAYALVSDSFRNWRGMSESGGRRIKRAVYIDMTSIKFCTPEMLERFRKFQVLGEYIDRRLQEIEKHNQESGIDTAELINGRRLTNVGTFRAYLIEYLRRHPKIHQNMTFLVRHLPPTATGLPIEIYVFSNDQVWANYEAIQADIFDHILAAIPQFELRVFQNPSGADFQTALSSQLRKM